MKNTPTAARHPLHPRRRHDRAGSVENAVPLSRRITEVGRAGGAAPRDQRRAIRPKLRHRGRATRCAADKAVPGWRSVLVAPGANRRPWVSIAIPSPWNGATFGTWLGLRGKTRWARTLWATSIGGGGKDPNGITAPLGDLQRLERCEPGAARMVQLAAPPDRCSAPDQALPAPKCGEKPAEMNLTGSQLGLSSERRAGEGRPPRPRHRRLRGLTPGA